jgi:hypothetical protein
MIIVNRESNIYRPSFCPCSLKLGSGGTESNYTLATLDESVCVCGLLWRYTWRLWPLRTQFARSWRRRWLWGSLDRCTRNEAGRWYESHGCLQGRIQDLTIGGAKKASNTYYKNYYHIIMIFFCSQKNAIFFTSSNVDAPQCIPK